MKKGEMHFNWIFIMIVGAVFLAFFTGFAIKYKDLQERKTEITMLNNINTALTNLQSSSFVISTRIDLPLDINIDCSNNGYSIFINEKNKADVLIASKKNIKRSMHAWYQPYKIPFKITNFYYLTDDSPINIATNNVNLVNSIKEEMPDDFKSKINVYNGNNFVVNGDLNKGTVTVDEKEVPYFGKEMLYAAVLSSNYSCFYNNIKNEINKAVSIHESKARILTKSGCNYNLILSKINLLSDINDLDYGIVKSIEDLNKNLISINCAGLY